MKPMFGSLISSLLFATPAFADDAAWTLVGGAGNFSNNKQIRMVAERVKIDLHDVRSHFHADFEFRNDGPATTVQMAFPEEAHDWPAVTKGVIHRFRSTVAGVRVPVKRHRLHGETFQGSEYQAVWIKRVNFQKNQTKRVSVDYWADNGDIGDYVQNSYILKTGATWKDRIGDCIITIDWSDLYATTPMISTGRGSKVKHPPLARSVELRFKDFEPDFDIKIAWANCFWNFIVNGQLTEGSGLSDGRMPIAAGNPKDPLIIARLVPCVFNQWPDGFYDPIGTPFRIGKHTARVLNRSEVEIDGKRKALRRIGPMVGDFQGVYLRDVIEAIGGRYTYVERQGFVYINLK